MHTPTFRQIAVSIAAVALLFSINALRAQPSFTLIPTEFGYAWGVAANGTVVGETSGATQPAQWTMSGGVTLLPTAPPDIYGAAHAVSRNGSVIAGIGNSPVQAVRWIAGETAVGLEIPPLTPSSQAWGISDNGAVIIGEKATPAGGEAFRWTESSGMIGLGLLPGATSSFAYDASDEGAVVGSSGQAFRWTETGGMVGLGYLPGDHNSFATAISADGSIITGSSSASGGTGQPFLWTEEGGMVGLGLLPNKTFAYSQAMTADGSVIVGATSFSSDMTGGGFIWTQSEGMRAFADVLGDFGLGSQLADLTEIVPTAISADGRYVVGSSTFQHWILDRGVQNFAPVPEPSTYGRGSQGVRF